MTYSHLLRTELAQKQIKPIYPHDNFVYLFSMLYFVFYLGKFYKWCI